MICHHYPSPLDHNGIDQQCITDRLKVGENYTAFMVKAGSLTITLTTDCNVCLLALIGRLLISGTFLAIIGLLNQINGEKNLLTYRSDVYCSRDYLDHR